MYQKLIILCIIIFCISSTHTFTQTEKLSFCDSASKSTDNIQNCIGLINSKSQIENDHFLFKDYFVLIGNDFLQDITSPYNLRSNQLFSISLCVGGLVGLVASSEYFDEPIQNFSMQVHNSSQTFASISSFITKFGGDYELYSLAALGSYGFIFNNEKMKTTILLVSQAYITSGLFETAIKYITGRQRPSYYHPVNKEAEPTFHGIGFTNDGSFPSGHTTVIFAAATVFAKEYYNIKWVPITAYGIATLVGLSRMTENKHWVTDVIAGATLGYLCGRQVVNKYHNYKKLKSWQKNGNLSFNLNYNGGNLEPCVIYTFRK